jgi:hypothetical protein
MPQTVPPPSSSIAGAASHATAAPARSRRRLRVRRIGAAMAAAAAATMLALAPPACAAAGPLPPSTSVPCMASPAADAPDPAALIDDARAETVRTWDAGPLRRHRVWVTATATNAGDQRVTVYPIREIEGDGSSAGRFIRSLGGVELGPHGSGVMALSFYVPDGARTVAVRVRRLSAPDRGEARRPEDHPPTAIGAVHIAWAARCSASTFEPGEMPAPMRALLVEAMGLYAQDALVPPHDPQKALHDALLEATGAQEAQDLTEAIRYQMFLVHDRHSYFRPAPEIGAFYEALKPRRPEVELRADGIAVLRLYTAGSPAQEELVAYARDLRTAIADVAARRPRAWVVDLRAHGGGNMWAGLAGVSALLGGPRVGAFVGRSATAWWYAENGQAGTDGVAAVDAQAPAAPRFDGPVAVLIGPGTASSGEALAVAFEGRPRTRFFGAATLGYTNSGVGMHYLSDGTLFGIAETRNADRTGRVREGAILPDVPVETPADDSEPPREAIDWLLRQAPVPAG